MTMVKGPICKMTVSGILLPRRHSLAPAVFEWFGSTARQGMTLYMIYIPGSWGAPNIHWMRLNTTPTCDSSSLRLFIH